MNLLLTQSFAALRSIDHQKRVGCPAGLLHEPPFPSRLRFVPGKNRLNRSFFYARAATLATFNIRVDRCHQLSWMFGLRRENRRHATLADHSCNDGQTMSRLGRRHRCRRPAKMS